jgi:hypothetical protein
MRKSLKMIDYPIKVPKLIGKGMETIVIKIGVTCGMNGEQVVPGEYCAAIDAVIMGRRAQIAQLKSKAALSVA